VLATVDDRDYRNALAQAQAEVEKGEAQLAGYEAAVIQQVAQVETSKADVSNAEAALTFAQQEAKRYQDLLSSGSGTSQRAQQTQSDLLQKQAAVTKTRAALDASQKQVATFRALERSAQATIAGARAKVEKAQLDLAYTAIRAPIDGVVGDRSVRPGQYVQPGTALLTVVPMERGLYLVANFKETQIGHMVPGQAVTFTVDAFGDHPFRGTVESFAPGTGSQFALLPPENATGNFTKVVQRVPVRIKLADDRLLPRLRPGLSVEATVETRGDDTDGDGRTRLSLATP
jgi:membrane fusion protein, multidrug efflux system